MSRSRSLVPFVLLLAAIPTCMRQGFDIGRDAPAPPDARPDRQAPPLVLDGGLDVRAADGAGADAVSADGPQDGLASDTGTTIDAAAPPELDATAAQDVPQVGDAVPLLPDAAPASDQWPPTDGQPSQVLATYGFETGETPWSVLVGPGDTVTQSSAMVRTGSFAGRCSTDTTPQAYAALFTTFPPQTGLHVEMWLYLHSGFTPPLGGYVNLVRLESNAGSGVVNVGVEPGALQVISRNYTGAVTYFGSGGLQAGVWHRLEVVVRIAGPLGSISISVDGAPALQQAAVDLGSTAITQAVVGLTWQGKKNEPFVALIDDIVISAF